MQALAEDIDLQRGTAAAQGTVVTLRRRLAAIGPDDAQLGDGPAPP
jgi:hypothetical protein